jgi:hypothetical protein
MTISELYRLIEQKLGSMDIDTWAVAYEDGVLLNSHGQEFWITAEEQSP